MISPYFQDNRPVLVDSIVLFIDILGSRERASSGQAEEHLQRLYDALAYAHDMALDDHPDNPYRTLTFTDNVVLGSPIPEAFLLEGELGSTFLQACYYQFALATYGYFVRGGLACGPVCIGQNFAFGPGLNEAYRLEQDIAVHPRIVLSQRAVSLALKHARAGGDVSQSAQNATILYSGDGEAFLNYLDVLNELDTDFHKELLRHKEAIEDALAEYSMKPRVFEKYRWLADYHNHFCVSDYPDFTDLLINSDSTTTSFVTLAAINERFEKEQT